MQLQPCLSWTMQVNFIHLFTRFSFFLTLRICSPEGPGAGPRVHSKQGRKYILEVLPMHTFTHSSEPPVGLILHDLALWEESGVTHGRHANCWVWCIFCRNLLFFNPLQLQPWSVFAEETEVNSWGCCITCKPSFVSSLTDFFCGSVGVLLGSFQRAVQTDAALLLPLMCK